jgi:hypothetical protein
MVFPKNSLVGLHYIAIQIVQVQFHSLRQSIWYGNTHQPTKRFSQ